MMMGSQTVQEPDEENLAGIYFGTCTVSSSSSWVACTPSSPQSPGIPSPSAHARTPDRINT